MQRRQNRVVERLNGLGRLKRGSKTLAHVSYNAVFTRQVIIIDKPDEYQELEGATTITGNFTITDTMKFHLDSDQHYTLELSDKREIDILIPFTHLASSRYRLIVDDVSKFEPKKK